MSTEESESKTKSPKYDLEAIKLFTSRSLKSASVKERLSFLSIITRLVKSLNELDEAKGESKTLSDQFTLFPIRDETSYDFFKEHQSSYWTTEEIDFAEDVKQWPTLDDNLKRFIEKIFAFFASADGIILVDTVEISSKSAKTKEEKLFYAVKAFMECIHWETYSTSIDTIVPDAKRRTELLNAIDSDPTINALGKWIQANISEELSDAENMVATAFVEGVLFSGPFCSLYWLKRQGKLPGLTFSNELIARDEFLHCRFECHRYLRLCEVNPEEKLSQERIYQIFNSGMKHAEAFFNDALNVALIGMDSTEMKKYVHSVADDVLTMLGYQKLYKVPNPFDWMELISLGGKTNFFERRVGEYSRKHGKGIEHGRVVKLTVDVDV
jgi:ribonucleoside-diphosphate reductase beta chain